MKLIFESRKGRFILFVCFSILIMAFFFVSCSMGGKSRDVKKPKGAGGPYDPVPDLIKKIKHGAGNGESAQLAGVLESLYRLLDPRGLAAVEEVLRKKNLSPQITKVFLRALGEYSNPDTLPLLMEYHRNESKVVSDAARAAIERICPPLTRVVGKRDVKKSRAGAGKIRNNRRRGKRLTGARIIVGATENRGSFSGLAAGMLRLRVLRAVAGTKGLYLWHPECVRYGESVSGSVPVEFESLPLFKLNSRVAVKEADGRTLMRATLVLSDENNALKGSSGGRAGVRGSVNPVTLRELTSSLSDSIFDDIRRALP